MTSSHSGNRTIVGQGDLRFEVEPHWPQLPEGWKFHEAVDVAVDSRGRVFVFSRSEHPMTIFDSAGNFLSAWGEGQFARPHGLFIGRDDAVYCADDQGQVVYKFTTEGRLVATLGKRGKPSNTGIVDGDYRTIRRSSGPFNLPTNAALAPSGDLYVSDGYGNARIHQFGPDGQLVRSWGEPGSGPGQFQIPHGVGVGPDGTVYVSDRENSRLQLFSPEGEYLTSWTDLARPCLTACDSDGNVYVTEMGYLAGMYPGNRAPSATPSGSRVSIFNREGKLLARFGGGEYAAEPGTFYAAHGIALDVENNLYVTEVRPGRSYGDGMSTTRTPPPFGTPVVQKFRRITDAPE